MRLVARTNKRSGAMRNDLLNGVITKKQADVELRAKLSSKAGLLLSWCLLRPLDKVWKGRDWRQLVLDWMRAQGEADAVYTDGADEFATYVWKNDGGRNVSVQVKIPRWLNTVLTVLKWAYELDVTNEQFKEILLNASN
jgi:hypothetical protein